MQKKVITNPANPKPPKISNADVVTLQSSALTGRHQHYSKHQSYKYKEDKQKIFSI